LALISDSEPNLIALGLIVLTDGDAPLALDLP
jgi:hypothetical protein